MRYYSTTKKCPRVGFRDAVLQGLAPDSGLYMPEEVPKLSETFWRQLEKLSFAEMAVEIAAPYVAWALSAAQLRQVVKSSADFAVPLVPLGDHVQILELFHGPTLAFKDFGARFLAQVLQIFAEEANRQFIVLAATSGDTGSAVANACYGLAGVRVVLLYPKGRISRIQEQQIATLGGNVVALEVEGSFDDCQGLVKQAFGSAELRDVVDLTSANSINIARLIPQMFYYFGAYAALCRQGKISPCQSVVFSVPSGNFGNLTAACLAKRMGLPVEKLVAATNANKVVPDYLQTGEFRPQPSIATISNAMDVGNPSNFYRLLDIYRGDVALMRKDIIGFSFRDDETRQAIKQCFSQYGYVLDPHGAVSYLGLREYQKMHKTTSKTEGIVLETAHPAKFLEVVQEAIGEKVNIPQQLASYLEKPKCSVSMSPEFQDFRELLLSLDLKG